MAKRVRDAEGGVSQCGEQRSTKRSEARSSPTRRETPKKINVLLVASKVNFILILNKKLFINT
jgi:hypothetical protein